ncbi:transcriptional regulator [Pseudoduganella eburnea]|uniref:Transcriptional regulator n=1 Tax=Massilia eburnea TaxID=1776165 RepID=A0A6L6QCM2_9BURK|nr:winged helix-turn-helix domain-containing protein [Massilia eburnea]MTW09794.1 transcriptional regulator [Massilia eburnea]
MTNSPAATLRVGDWSVNRLTGELARDGACLRLEERTLRLLTFMADHAGEVLSADDLLTHAWPGVVVSPDSLYQAITLLRRQLGDDARNPSYIATVPRRGYRLVAQVTQGAGLAEPAASPAHASEPAAGGVPNPAPADLPPQARPPLHGRRVAIVAGFAALLAAGLVALPIARTSSTRSVAVLPFLDLTDEMNEEPFADGISEELIGKLSKQPGLSVAPPGASYYYKNKHDAAAEAARVLKVAYVLDGSIRRSGGALRISARLTRAADGFVVWSDSYDRTPGDKLAIQDEVAGIVSRAAVAKIQ